jgi:hypothetical protein
MCSKFQSNSTGDFKALGPCMSWAFNCNVIQMEFEKQFDFSAIEGRTKRPTERMLVWCGLVAPRFLVENHFIRYNILGVC